MNLTLIRWEVLTVVLILIGFAAVYSLFWIRLINAWRIRWIYLEHQLAKLENRNPRNISDVFPDFFSTTEQAKK